MYCDYCTNFQLINYWVSWNKIIIHK